MERVTREVKKEREVLKVLRQGYDFPYFSAQDVAGFGEFTPQKLHKILESATASGLLVRVSEGQTFSVQQRYCHTHTGVYKCREEFGLPLKSHLIEGHQREFLQRLRLYEPIVRLAPRLFTSGVIDTPSVFPIDPDDDPREVVLDEKVSLVDFSWLQATVDVPRHGLCTYRTRNADLIYFIFATVGMHHGARGHRGQARDETRTLHDFSHGLSNIPSFQYGLTPVAPSGVIFIVLDHLAGLYVQRAYPDLPKAIIDCEGRIIEKLMPAPPAGRFSEITAAGPVRLPESEVRRLDVEPHTKALRGKTRTRVFEHVNAYGGTTPRLIAEAIGQPESKVKRIVQDLIEADLVEFLDGGLYLTRRGRTAAAHRDRLHPNAVHGLLGHLTAGDSSHRTRRLEHERDVDRLASRLRRIGVDTFPGWRLEIHHETTSLNPDLWALVPMNATTALWHAVEVERSAFAPSEIDRKVGNYRLAKENGDTWPQLWVVGKGIRGERGLRHDEEAADRYVSRCTDLPMLVLPHYLAFHQDLSHLESGWRARNGKVPINYLQGQVGRSDLEVPLNPRIVDGFPSPPASRRHS